MKKESDVRPTWILATEWMAIPFNEMVKTEEWTNGDGGTV